jgi:hypothetical protein
MAFLYFDMLVGDLLLVEVLKQQSELLSKVLSKLNGMFLV